MPELAYSVTKHIHVWCVTISFILFAMRSAWHVKESMLLELKWVKVLPHCVDTLLLASGALLAFSIYPVTNLPAWLELKLICLLLYICLGIVAFRTKKLQKLAIFCALGAFFFIAYLAISKAPIY